MEIGVESKHWGREGRSAGGYGTGGGRPLRMRKSSDSTPGNI